MLRLFCAWIFFQCFFYAAIPFLRINLGIGINLTPDKPLFLAMLFVLARRPVPAGASAPFMRSARAVGITSSIFAMVALTSWFVNGADAQNHTFAELTRVLNLAFFPALTYLVARRLRYTRRMLDELLWFFAILSVYLSITAVAEHFNVTWLVYPKYILDPKIGIQFGRSRGPFVNTIGNGAMLVLGFVACSCLVTSLRGVKRILMFGLILCAVPAIYFTETRSVWLAFASVIATLLAGRTALRSVGAGVTAVVIAAFVIGIGSKFSVFDQTLFSRRQNTVDYRLDNYQIAWNAFTSNPLFGTGYGRFQATWTKYADLRNSRLGTGLDDGNHSTLFGILAELGLAGAVPFVCAIAFAAFFSVTAYRHLREPQTAYQRQFALVAIGALEIFVVIGLTSDLRTSPTVNIIAFWFVGVLCSLDAARRASETPPAVEPNVVGSQRWKRPVRLPSA
jgi:O-antigen ligase